MNLILCVLIYFFVKNQLGNVILFDKPVKILNGFKLKNNLTIFEYILFGLLLSSDAQFHPVMSVILQSYCISSSKQ